MLWVLQRRAKKNAVSDITRPYNLLQATAWKHLASSLFWQLDIVGMVLLASALGLTLTPLSLAKREGFNWITAKVLVPLILGILCFPAFVLWEKRAVHPMMPFHV